MLIVALVICQGCVIFNGRGKHAKASPDEVEFAKLNWTVGGIDGSRAELTNVLVSDLNMTPNGLSYKWKENDLSVWGYARTQADARTCVFYLKDGVWKGGFYEWISTSRTTRNYANIKGKYKGWNWNDIPNGSDAAFVIISKDGKKRTNVLKGKWVK